MGRGAGWGGVGSAWRGRQREGRAARCAGARRTKVRARPHLVSVLLAAQHAVARVLAAAAGFWEQGWRAARGKGVCAAICLVRPQALPPRRSHMHTHPAWSGGCNHRGSLHACMIYLTSATTFMVSSAASCHASRRGCSQQRDGCVTRGRCTGVGSAKATRINGHRGRAHAVIRSNEVYRVLKGQWSDQDRLGPRRVGTRCHETFEVITSVTMRKSIRLRYVET